MITIRDSFVMNALTPIRLQPDVLSQKIAGNYRLLNDTVTAQDFVHMTAQRPEIYIGTKNNSAICVEWKDTGDNAVRLEMMNQFLNRILCILTPRFTYQDEVYLTAILRKMGILNIKEFIDRAKHVMRQSVWTDRLVKQAVSKEKELREETETFTKEKELREETETFTKEKELREERETLTKETESFLKESTLHRQIFCRLETAEICRAVYFMQKAYYESRAVSPEYGILMQFGRLADKIRLDEIRQETNRKENFFWDRQERSRKEKSFWNRQERNREEKSFWNRQERNREEKSFWNRQEMYRQISAAVLINLVRQLSCQKPEMWEKIREEIKLQEGIKLRERAKTREETELRERAETRKETELRERAETREETELREWAELRKLQEAEKTRELREGAWQDFTGVFYGSAADIFYELQNDRSADILTDARMYGYQEEANLFYRTETVLSEDRNRISENVPREIRDTRTEAEHDMTETYREAQTESEHDMTETYREARTESEHDMTETYREARTEAEHAAKEIQRDMQTETEHAAKEIYRDIQTDTARHEELLERIAWTEDRKEQRNRYLEYLKSVNAHNVQMQQFISEHMPAAQEERPVTVNKEQTKQMIRQALERTEGKSESILERTKERSESILERTEGKSESILEQTEEKSEERSERDEARFREIDKTEQGMRPPLPANIQYLLQLTDAPTRILYEKALGISAEENAGDGESLPNIRLAEADAERLQEMLSAIQAQETAYARETEQIRRMEQERETEQIRRMEQERETEQIRRMEQERETERIQRIDLIHRMETAAGEEWIDELKHMLQTQIQNQKSYEESEKQYTRNAVMTNHDIQKQLQETKRELLTENKKLIHTIVNDNLHTQMKDISNRVYLDLEKKLAGERKRRGY